MSASRQDAGRACRCGTPIGADAFLSGMGEALCRVCFYAEQTDAQNRRVQESFRRVSLFDLVRVGPKIAMFAILFVCAGAFFAGSIRDGAWLSAAAGAALMALATASTLALVRSTRRDE